MLMSYVLNSIGHGEHRLKGIAGTVLDRTIKDSTDLLGSGAKRISFDAADPSAVRHYATEQVITIEPLYKEMSGRLDEIETLRSIYADVEIPLEPFLWGMEHHGTLVDPEVLESLRIELEARKDSLVARAYELAGRDFNLGSPKQLEVVLYDELLLPAPRASKSGSRSTKEEVLSGLTEHHEMPQIILDYRATTKLISTYIGGLSRENQSYDAAHPHFVFTSQCFNWAPCFGKSEPTEHSYPYGRRSSGARSLCRASQPRAPHRGLFADRTSRHGASNG